MVIHFMSHSYIIRSEVSGNDKQMTDLSFIALNFLKHLSYSLDNLVFKEKGIILK